MNKFTECPECGTEIIEAEDCPSCGGRGIVRGNNVHYVTGLGNTNMEDCLDCKGTGRSGNYYCPQCGWSHEE